MPSDDDVALPAWAMGSGGQGNKHTVSPNHRLQRLDIPVGGGNGSTLGAGSLAGDGSCSAPNVRLRFYEGAALGEVLPPNGRLELEGRGAKATVNRGTP